MREITHMQLYNTMAHPQITDQYTVCTLLMRQSSSHDYIIVSKRHGQQTEYISLMGQFWSVIIIKSITHKLQITFPQYQYI